MEDFLQLTPEEMTYIEVKLRLSHAVRERRRRQTLTQSELAERLRSSGPSDRWPTHTLTYGPGSRFEFCFDHIGSMPHESMRN